ncbi:MAG TPA: POTRA domain-containing protein [Steroidobacteraceae bacterium]|nr:POTRA domain-containing protein [Steroidobacteraceae bacterium]
MRWRSGQRAQCAGHQRAAAPLLALLLVPMLARGADAPAVDSLGDAPLPVGVPPPETPGIPPDTELEASKAVIGEILIDNQNIFNLSDPKDDHWLFRLADHLHARTRPRVIRSQLLFKPGDRYSRRLIDETERILRANNYFYDAWIRPVKYHDGKVDLRVTTRDVWTLNPGFNYSRTGGTNTEGEQLEDLNFFGTGTDVRLLHEINIDRTESVLQLGNTHAFGTWTQVGLTWAENSDGHLRDLSINHPFYALDTRWAAGVSGNNDAQSDSLYDRGNIVDQFRDQHNYVSVYGGWSPGLQNGWVQRVSTGLTYDEHQFSPLSTWTGATLLPEDRRFLYPWLEYDLVADDFVRLYNHDQILRTEDFYLGTIATVRLGWANSALGSSQSALLFQSTAGRGFRNGGSTLLLASDFSGRVEDGTLYNGLADASVRYYVEQSSNWLFFTTLVGTKAWRPDLDNQVLLGGDNGLRGYPLRYQDGTARALFTVEQRYFTNWFPFRLFRVGGAIFFDAGRTWGEPPLAQPPLGTLKDAGFGLRFGNARSGLGNVIHVDVAFPFETAGTTIRRAQFLVTTQQSF